METFSDSSLDRRLPTQDVVAAQPAPALLHAGFGCDPDVAVAALVSGPGARAFALDAHGGGETALALLSRGAREVVCVPLYDPDGTSAVLALKAAAIGRLTRLDYLAFVGLRRAARGRRRALYDLVRAELDAPRRAFWDRHEETLLRGLFTQEADVAQGRLLRSLLRTHLPKEAYRALLYSDRAGRLAAFERFISGRRFWENALRMCAIRPQFRDCLEGECSPLTCDDPMGALRRLVEVGPAGCPVWARAFSNDAGVEAALPWHLSAAGYETLRAHIGALRIAVAPCVETLTQDRGHFDAFDLTRARAALPASEFAALLGAVVTHARPGGRVLAASTDVAGLDLPSTLARDEALERYVASCDRAPGGVRAVLRCG